MISHLRKLLVRIPGEMWTVLATIGCLAVIIGASGVGFQNNPLPSPTPTPIPFAPAGSLAGSTEPVHLLIPAIQVDSQIVPTGTDNKGAMLTPEGPIQDPVWSEAFWWRFGALPGQVGNSVIAGHLDKVGGSPAIFWKLQDLHVGDSVSVIDASGRTLKFTVTQTVTYPDSSDPAILNKVFGPSTTSNLNLITCSGDWTGTEYNKRLVVYTTLDS